ncbi:hypothetical protein PtA15_14A431 [Puccinia triticina]|uniref:Major facilitator superfamily (MFS) profile domain-containing protein n=1 Tax=Puccinia triticina TaxID=208348 RepID=A0ABY7D5J3_9BASI|nr:uncharacterized protein PtA15_14A431 [Puccinia triticina]WAQ91547.1 hypothetical protein PtA15_14A431 [Puccinia triticina]WAR62349.1 hypothetical protein PtB15_14B444 [Puccinia triticina]
MCQESGEKSTECCDVPLDRQLSIDPLAEREAVRRSDWIILPITFVYSFLSHLDRSNLGNARVAGLQESLKMTDFQFSVALTMTFVPYVAAELPINLVLKRIGANIMIPLLGLLVTRFFLGAVEGGLYPATVLYVSNSYKSSSNVVRYFSLFLSTAGIYSASPTLYAWIANNSAPHYRKATAIALGPIAANTGGIVSTWLFASSQDSHHQAGPIVNLCFAAGIAVFCSINLVWLRSCNKKKVAQIEETAALTEKRQSIVKNINHEEWLRLGDKFQTFKYSY